jgi:hypothetical protein
MPPLTKGLGNDLALRCALFDFCITPCIGCLEYRHVVEGDSVGSVA